MLPWFKTKSTRGWATQHLKQSILARKFFFYQCALIEATKRAENWNFEQLYMEMTVSCESEWSNIRFIFICCNFYFFASLRNRIKAKVGKKLSGKIYQDVRINPKFSSAWFDSVSLVHVHYLFLFVSEAESRSELSTFQSEVQRPI
jgi:hypothetical protein